MTTVAIVAFPLANETIFARQFTANLTMANLYFGYQPIESVYWSLAIELGFYGMMAAVFALNQLRRIEVLGTIWVLISAFVFKIFPAIGAVIPWRLQAATALPWAPLFFAGILLYRMRVQGANTTRLILLAGCLAVLISRYTMGYALGSIGVFAVFTFACAGWLPFLKWKPLTILGAISYPLYLVHQSIGMRIQDAVVTRLGANAYWGLAGALICVVSLAAAVSYGVERRTQRWLRERFARNWRA